MSEPILSIQDIDGYQSEHNVTPIIADNIHIPEEVEVETTTQYINLQPGWNLISTYINVDSLPSKSVANILSSIYNAGNLIIVKDYIGQAYLPEWNFNGIGDWVNGQAYQIKVNGAQTLEITGERLTYTELGSQGQTYYGYEIELQGGWNFMGVPTVGAYNLVVVMDTLLVQNWTNVNYNGQCNQGPTMSPAPANIFNCGNGVITIVKNYLGSAYLPEWNFNGIGNLLPGQGYQIKLTGPTSNKYYLRFTETTVEDEWVFNDFGENSDMSGE